jgi:hypothetical protein
MRILVLLAGAMLLSGCGNSEDFTVDVALAPDRAKAELARLDGGAAMQTLSLAAIKADQSTRDEMAFVIPGDDGDGELVLRFEEVGRNGTRIHVALSVPAHTVSIDGKTMVLDETKVENALKQSLGAWAGGISTSGYASLDSINETLTGLSIALLSDKHRLELDQPGVGTALAGFGADEEAIGAPEQLAAGSDLDDPMLDPSRDAARAGQPMDDARGEDPSSDWGGEPTEGL